MKYLKLWILPLFISLGLFLVLRPAFAQVVGGLQSLEDHLKENDVEVGAESVDGYTQIYYIFNEQKNFITNGSVNSNIPATDGELIVYRKSLSEGDQIFLYNIITGQSIQITHSGHNTNPKVDGDNVVWEGLVPSATHGESDWQVFFFDGVKTVQLTSGDPSFNPEIEGDYITYTRRDITGTYRGVLYSIRKDEERDITTGIDAKYPKVKNGKIFLGGMGGEREFELTAEDMFVLNLVPLELTTSAEAEILDSTGSAVVNEASESGEVMENEVPETVMVDDIMQELEATVSGNLGFRI